MKEGEKLYANAVNLGGLYSSVPIPVYFNEELASYWAEDGDFEVKKIGTLVEDGIVTFASDRPSEAVAWTLGAKAVMKMLRKWSEA